MKCSSTRSVLDALVPGAADALQYPYYVPVVALADRRCHYCGKELVRADARICEPCEALHESSLKRSRNGLAFDPGE